MAISTITGTSTGSTGTVLTTGSPQSGGVIQVVSSQAVTNSSFTSSSNVSTGFSVTIIPKFSTSKILLWLTANMESNSANAAGFTFYRNGSNISIGGNNSIQYVRVYGSNISDIPLCMNFIDSPATTSSLTYTLYGLSSSSNTVIVGGGGGNTGNTAVNFYALEIAA